MEEFNILLESYEATKYAIEPITMSLIGMGLSAAGGLFGSGRRKKAAQALRERARKAIEETRLAGEQRVSGIRNAFQGAFSTLSGMDTLDIDTRFADQAYSNAQLSAESQFGRSLGEESARDTVRETTADAISRAQRTGGSVTDQLGFLGNVVESERRAMRDINQQSISQREQRIQNAMRRLQGAAQNRVNFYTQKEMAEFQSEQQKELALANLMQQGGLTVADAEFQNANMLINARNQSSQADSAYQQMRADNIQGLLGGVGSSLTQFGVGQMNNEMFAEMLGMNNGNVDFSNIDLSGLDNIEVDLSNANQNSGGIYS